MPKCGNAKGKAAPKPLAVHSLDNKPRYQTPEIQGQLPTPQATPPIVQLLSKAKVQGNGKASLVDRDESDKHDEESSGRDFSDEEHIDSGP